MQVVPSGKTNASGILFSWRDNSSFRCYTLGPLCLWQCFPSQGFYHFSCLPDWQTATTREDRTALLLIWETLSLAIIQNVPCMWLIVLALDLKNDHSTDWGSFHICFHICLRWDFIFVVAPVLYLSEMGQTPRWRPGLSVEPWIQSTTRISPSMGFTSTNSRWEPFPSNWTSFHLNFKTPVRIILLKLNTGKDSNQLESFWLIQ